MNSKMPMIVSLSVQESCGGPAKTIGAFKRALGASLYSFCDTRYLAADPLAVERANLVPSINLPVLREYCRPYPESAAHAEKALAESSIVSCHSFYRYHALWVNRMCRRHAVPYWFVPHGILDPWVMSYGRGMKQLYWRWGGQRFVDQSSVVIFATSLERDKATRQFDLPDTAVVHWPVDLVEVTQRLEHRSEIRGKLRIPQDARVLLYFGRMHSMKRPLELIRAMAKANEKDLHLIVVGNEQDVSCDDCRAMAECYALENRVHIVGPVYGDSKYDYLHASDAYVSLSCRENFNHTAAESLAAGMPVILSPGNDLTFDLGIVDCGWMLEDDSLESAVLAIKEFCSESSERLLQRGRNGREWVAETLSTEVFRAKLVALADRYGK